jgi:hypothetical protein
MPNRSFSPATIRRTWIKVQHHIPDGPLAERVAELQRREPDLNQFGWNPRQRDAFDLESVAWCMTWLATATGKDGDRIEEFGSYGLKHVAEKCRDDYVANGDLLAAALLLGLPVYRSPDWRDRDNPNGMLLLSREWYVCEDVRAYGRASKYAHEQGPVMTAVLCRLGLLKCRRRQFQRQCKHQGTDWVRHPYWKHHDREHEAELGREHGLTLG